MVEHRDNAAKRLFHHFNALSFITIATTLLISCSTTHRGDGPPNYDVDVSHIKNPVPKCEPPAKYGNMSSYKVLGKRYYTMKSSKCFEQTGTASWYGTKFHAKRTSSGEPYNMLSMTAAHKTLPLPTYVEVTNLANHKQIIVKVNDRGPFSDNRIIDLSYVAAKKLGMLGHGTAPVKIRAINPETDSLINKTHFLYLQAGAFSNKNNALKLKNRLAGMVSYPIKIVSPTFKNRLYRVQIGPFADMSSADTTSAKLHSLGISAKKNQGV